ncbi:MAG: fasciclin domain-containing protein, partial [Bacteroidia bacterium]|nr:fasciclin domain-containing protein [Bacteroidia bacterium]
KLTGDFEKLKNNDEYTVFAPTNQAFEQFPVEVITELFQPRNIEKLKSIAAYHIIEGRLRSSTIVADIDENNGLLATYKMLNGLEITTFYDEETIFIKDANGYPVEVLQQDILLSNGLVYKVDTVILPQVDNERQLAENN